MGGDGGLTGAFSFSFITRLRRGVDEREAVVRKWGCSLLCCNLALDGESER